MIVRCIVVIEEFLDPEEQPVYHTLYMDDRGIGNYIKSYINDYASAVNVIDNFIENNFEHRFSSGFNVIKEISMDCVLYDIYVELNDEIDDVFSKYLYNMLNR